MTAGIGGLPLWFPWVAPVVLGRFHIRYAAYERAGYSHFLLRDARYESGGIVFTAKQIEAGTPSLWLWRKWFGGADRPEELLRVSDWQLELSKNARPPAGPRSVAAALQQAQSILRNVRAWAPTMTLSNGVVHLAGHDLAARLVVWDRGNLRADFFWARWGQSAQLRGKLPDRLPWTAELDVPALKLQTDFWVDDAKGSGGRALDWRISIIWQTNRAEIEAEFGPDDLIPTSATLEAKDFQIPAQGADLQGYGLLTGWVHGQWTNGIFHLDIREHAQPLAQTNRLSPPLDLTLVATGNTNAVRIETASLSSPGLKAQLSPGLEMGYDGRMLSPEATFKIEAEADRQPWLPLVGHLEGEVIFRRQPTAFPLMSFSLASRNLEGFGVQTTTVNLKGRFAWPGLQIDSLSAQFANGSTADAQGGVNFQTHNIDQATLKLAGPITDYFFPDLSYDHLALTAQLEGPWDSPTNSGRVEVGGLATKDFAPVGIAASWSGKALRWERWSIAVTSRQNATLHLNGSATLASTNAEIDLKECSFANGSQKLVLLAPARIMLQPGILPGKPWQELAHFFALGTNFGVTAEPLRWRNGTTEFTAAGRLRWPEAGELSCSARNFSWEPFASFFQRPWPAVDLARLDSAVRWSNGPVNFSVGLQGTFQFPPSLTNVYRFPVTVQAEATGDAGGVSVSNLSVVTQDQEILSGSGLLPLALVPADDAEWLHLGENDPMRFRARVRPIATFWNQLTLGTRVKLDGPSMDLELGGTPNQPEGTLRLSIEHIEAGLTPQSRLLHGSKLAGTVKFSLRQIDLKEFSGLIEGQPLTVTGQLPLPANLVEDWKKDWREVLDWRKASGQARAKDVQLAAFVKFAPGLLAPQGTLDLDVSASAGQFSGQIALTNAMSQPMPDLGVIREIAARIKFEGKKVTLEQAHGLLGEVPVVISGAMDLGRQESATGLPYFEVQAKGDGVPIVRSDALILRAGFQTRISNTNGGAPVISGNVNLQNGYYLSDLRLLVPKASALPGDRPPYFAIDAKPYSAWRLDVNVTGNKFLKVNSPFFDGVISADFHLGGTLANPVALGEAKIASGQISFPFASLNVSQGDVFLTSADPYLPHLFVAASGRAYTYDLHMQVSGAADHPLVEFSSTAGLGSDQILRMLTTGELPINTGSFTTEQRAGRIGLFAGKNALNQMGLFPGGEERLTIGSGEGFGELTFPEEILQTYSAEYKLTRHWSLIGEYDPFGVNLGLKWLFYSK